MRMSLFPLLFLASCATSASHGNASERSEGARSAAERASPVPLSGVSEEAWRIHRNSILVDGHNDLPWSMREKAQYSLDAKDLSKPQPDLHTDLPRLVAGGMGAQFWSVYVPADSAKTGAALQQTIEQIEFVKKMAARYPEILELASTVADVERIRKEGRIACLIGAEGGHSMEGSIAKLRKLYELGVRYMTLTHSETIDIADSATDEPEHGGLSKLGEEVVAEMNRLGMLIDVSHVSDETMADVLALSKAPVIASHSSCRALAEHVRNVPDELLKGIARNGGVVMVNFFSGFVVDSSARKMGTMFAARRKMREEIADEAEFEAAMEKWRRDNPIERGTVETVIDHIDHIVKVAGIDSAGIGSDFDGIGETPVGLEDVSCYPRITQGLLDRGYSEEAIRKVLGGNALRALRKAEDVARGMR
ncbi:MAG: dipeptidase [Planctomycetota bacterium]